MAKVYAVKLDRSLNELCYSVLLPKATEVRQQKAMGYTRKEDRYRCLFTEFLVRYALVREGACADGVSFGYTEFGKPYLQCCADLHFNVSHSGDWIVCALDNAPVGVDVEQMLPLEVSEFDGFFSPREVSSLPGKDADERQAHFYDLWTLKESYMKQQGLGLSMAPDSFSIDLSPAPTLATANAPVPGYHFRQFDLDPEYRMALCTLTDAMEEINVIELKELLQYFAV